MNNEVELYVGYVGKTRGGDKVEITKNPAHYFVGDNGHSYWGDGLSERSIENSYDIIGPWEVPVELAKNYNDGLWYGWNGSSECPVHPKTIISIQTKYGGVFEGCIAADRDWGDGCIIASFKVTKEYKSTREYWIDEKAGVVYYSKVYGDVVHVREVIE